MPLRCSGSMAPAFEIREMAADLVLREPPYGAWMDTSCHPPVRTSAPEGPQVPL